MSKDSVQKSKIRAVQFANSKIRMQLIFASLINETEIAVFIKKSVNSVCISCKITNESLHFSHLT